jgi:Putative bacterial sensory transduction regulator
MWGKKVDTMIRTVDQDELAAIVREAGYKALVKSTEEGGSQYQGDAYIETAQNGWQTFITFYNKTEDGKYTSVQFGLRLNDNEGTFGGTARMNEFNSRWRFVKGVINADNSFRIQMDVDLDGGVSREYLIKRVGLWDYLLGSFNNFTTEVHRERAAAEAEVEKVQHLH